MYHLVSYGFLTSNVVPCVLIRKTEAFLIAIYMDDITLHGPGSRMMKNVISTLKFEFEVTDLGVHPWPLGIHIKFGLKGKELL
jgi:hypothetical protein